MDTNLQLQLEEKYEQVYPMTEVMTFERIHPQKKTTMFVDYCILGVDFVMKLNKPQEYVAILVMTNQKRKDKRVEGLILASNGFTVDESDFKNYEFTGILGQKIERLHSEGDLWLQGEPQPKKKKEAEGIFSSIKNLFS